MTEEPNALKRWFNKNADGLVDLLESMDDTEVDRWNPAFAATHKAWKRDRAEQKRKLDGAARRLSR